MKRFPLISIIIFTLIFTIKSVSFAQVLEGDKHIFKLGEEAIKNTNKSLIKPVEEDKTIRGDGFTAILSYKEDFKNLPLIMSLSSDVVNFGHIKPGEPIIRTLSFKILPGSAKGFQVFSIEDGNLKSEDDEIPATSCDYGNCNQILSDLWTLPLVYGFGFRCDSQEGSACNPKMDKNQYKRFANEKANEAPVRILYSPLGSPSSSVISYKINIPGNQPQGGYQNIIKYIITPNL